MIYIKAEPRSRSRRWHGQPAEERPIKLSRLRDVVGVENDMRNACDGWLVLRRRQVAEKKERARQGDFRGSPQQLWNFHGMVSPDDELAVC
jgi:hypothetical protein